MSAFEEINGVPSTGNSFLLRQVLRDEWKFKGVVISDAEAVHELVVQGLCADDEAAARMAFMAGVDVEMFSSTYRSNLETLVTEDKVPMKAIDDSVRRVLRLKWELGLFDKPFARPNPDEVLLSKEHLEVAREFAKESLVLLKNENRTLPLWKEVPSIAVIGPLADSGADQLGTWHAHGEGKEARTALQAIREAVGKTARINYAIGV